MRARGRERARSAGEGCLNSTGFGAILSPRWTRRGGSRWTANQECLPPAGPGATANGIKLQVVTADAAGTASTTVDIASVGNVQVGDTKYYQARFRDDTTLVCGSGQNTTNGLRILWDPSN